MSKVHIPSKRWFAALGQLRPGFAGIGTVVSSLTAPPSRSSASATPDSASAPAPTSIGAATIASEVRKENLANIVLPPYLGGTTFFMTRAHRPQHSWGD